MGSSSSFNRVSADLSGKIFVITGANNGIGKVAALRLAERNATVILACRSKERTLPVIQQIKELYPRATAEFIQLDLTDLESVLKFSEEVKQKYAKIDVLLNNAGVMLIEKLQLTKQKFEMQLGTNHFGHFVLTNQLLPLIKKSPEGRIVNVSSIGHEGFMGGKANIYFDDVNYKQRKYHSGEAYAQSKLANILFTNQLQRELDQQGCNIICMSLHPGVIRTGLQRHMEDSANCCFLCCWSCVKKCIMTPEEGALQSLMCCTESVDKLQKGAYYKDLKLSKPSKLAQDAKLAQKFWDFSNQQVKDFLIDWK